MLFFRPYVERSHRSAPDVRQHQHFDDLHASLQALAAWARRHDVHFRIALAPSKAEVYRWLLPAPPHATPDTATAWSPFLQNFCQEEALACLDLTPVLVREARRRYAGSRLLWWPDDTHWNEAGHALVAATLHARLLCPEGAEPASACAHPARE